MARQHMGVRRPHSRIFMGTLAIALGFAVVATHPSAEASQFPSSAEAKLTDIEIEPADGFNLQIDDNGFSNAGGNLTSAHMYCVQAKVKFRCGIGPDDELRVQGTLSDANLDETKGNILAWMLTHRVGYSDIELQNAIWCITNPGVIPKSVKGAQLCAAAQSAAVPSTPLLTLTTLGSGTANEGSEVHFSMTTNAPSVNLSVSDGGAGPYLCGSAPHNAAATISNNQLRQSVPAAQRNFELCLVRDNVASSSTATLRAELEATVANVQIWKHPTAPQNCQGLIDAALTAPRISASADGTWDSLDGWITVTKSVVGDTPCDVTFTVELSNATGVIATHSFPDADEAPWTHTFADLAPGEYVITETVTGGATHVTVTPGGPIVVASDEGTVVDVVNEFVGQLKLTKRTDIPVNETFVFSVDCVYRQDPVGDWDNPVRLRSGETFITPELPAGTVCTVNESDAGSALSTMIALDALGVQTQTVGTQSGSITVRNGETTDVVFTNNFSQGTTSTSSQASTTTSSGTGGSTSSIGTTSSTNPATIGSLGSTTSTSATGTLADTGADSDRMASIAGFSMIAGGVLVLATHRRRRLRTTL